jgi:cobalt-zinc-cadmium efflux system outer membrane protein
MRSGPALLAAALASTTLLAGCASYAPAPLKGDAEALLAQPDLGAAAVDAAIALHPRLKPVPIDLSQPLTPDALGLIAVIANPDLKAARAKAKVADAQVFAAGLLPDPVITLGADHILSGPDVTDALIAQLAVDLVALRDRQVILRGQRAARDQVRLDLAWQEWQTNGKARLLAARIAGLSQTLALDAETRAAADANLARVLAADARGDVRGDEVVARRLAAADAADKTRNAERDLKGARLDLNRLLGLRPDTEIRVAAARPSPPPLDTEALFTRARGERLDLHALEAGYDSQEAAVRKAVMDQFPTLELTITRARDTTDNQTLGPSVNFTLPLWNRNRGGIAQAQATRDQLRAEYAARLFSTRADIADLVDGLKIEQRQRDEIVAQVAPLTRLSAASEAAAARGDLARDVADATRQSVVDKRLALAGLDQAMAEQTVALELAVGAPLDD